MPRADERFDGGREFLVGTAPCGNVVSLPEMQIVLQLGQ